jgi:hypothetical protein
MHQSPQKLLGGRREKYGPQFALADDDAVPLLRQHRTSQGKPRKSQWRDDVQPEPGRPGPRQHPRG